MRWKKGLMAVELLVKAGYLKADKTLPWCARVEMVLSFFGMLRVLDQAKIMRCDFKPDQICI